MTGRFTRSFLGAAAIALVAGTAPLLAADTAGGPTDADLMNDAASTGDVLTYGMGPQAQRFSTLNQINTDTVSKLVPAFASSLGGEKQRGQEAQPLVYERHHLCNRFLFAALCLRLPHRRGEMGI